VLTVATWGLAGASVPLGGHTLIEWLGSCTWWQPVELADVELGAGLDAVLDPVVLDPVVLDFLEPPHAVTPTASASMLSAMVTARGTARKHNRAREPLPPAADL
jgi:hypothetical protein